MAHEKKDSKVSLKSSKKTISSVIYTLNVPNFFILPQYDGTVVESPSFEYANATWRFKFLPYSDEIRNCKLFEIFLSKINSEIPEIAIIFSIALLDADGEKYCNGSNAVIFDFSLDTELCIERFSNKKPFYDRRGTLTLIIHLISDESLKVVSDQVPLTTDEGFMFCPNIADETKDSEVSLKSSKNTISSLICTLNVPNFFILPEYDGTEFDVESPSFEYANRTWRFKFLPATEKTIDCRSFEVYLLKVFDEYAEIAIICSIALLDTDGEEYDNGYNAVYYYNFDDRIYIHSFDNKKPSYERLDFLTLIIHLSSDKSFNVASDKVPLTTDKDINVLSQDFKKLFLNGNNHDLTLRVADKEFRVHQDILMARSQVFQAMLTHDMTEKNEGIIDVPDCDPQAMEQFLFYVYSGKVETLNQENALGLYYAADKYNMTLLKEQCTEYIKKSLTPSIICGVIQLALNHSDSDLLECATEYFLDHTREIFPTLEWMSFMKTNSIAANELLIKASEKWNSAN